MEKVRSIVHEKQEKKKKKGAGSRRVRLLRFMSHFAVRKYSSSGSDAKSFAGLVHGQPELELINERKRGYHISRSIGATSDA